MNLSDALRLGAGDVVAFVGAGGKTTCMRRILQERAGQSLVVATTTTNLGVGETGRVPQHLIINTAQDFDQALSALGESGGVFLTGPLNDAGDKWTGLDLQRISRLQERVAASRGILLVEADGARRKMLKAPADHEPVIPAEATVVVPVCNLGVLGRPLNDRFVHRPERAARLLAIEAGDPLRTHHIAQLLRDEQGGLKDIPRAARVRAFLNGVETKALRAAGRDIAGELVGEQRIASVLLGAASGDDPVLEVWGKTGVVVLAAGGSTRFGGAKLLEEWRGKAILRTVVEMVLASGLQPAVVVLGPEYERHIECISDLPIQSIQNTQWAEGQSTSVRLGLAALNAHCEAIIFVLGDMPAVSSALMQELVEAHRQTLGSIIAPQINDRWGNPVLFDLRTFDDLALIEGDRGGRAIFDRFPPRAIPAEEGVLFDIDRRDDLAKPA